MSNTDDKPDAQLVHVPTVVSETHEMPREGDPAGPVLGDWYWVKTDNERDFEDEDHPHRWFACVVKLGSNYALMQHPDGGKRRIHFDHFEETCRFEPDPDAYINKRVGRIQARMRELQAKLADITRRLGIGNATKLAAGGETAALAVRGQQHVDMKKYEGDLREARDTGLPEVFRLIKSAHKGLATWMCARVLPLEGQSGDLYELRKVIDNRIFNVKLYSGLEEEVIQFASGTPAPAEEKIHLLQRRLYMDEEFIAQYDVGGADIDSLADWHAWLAKPENRDRLLPFPRTVVAFQVRRTDKDRQINHISDIFRVAAQAAADKTTFLYMRNGEQLFCLETTIDFDTKLFPDIDRQILNGEIYARLDSGGGDLGKIIPAWKYNAILEEENREYAIYEAMTEEEQEDTKNWKLASKFRFWPHDSITKKYKLYSQDNVWFDDITALVQEEVGKHNRLVLVLQGLLDRSKIFHPHPPWQLWKPETFQSVLELHYDDDRALVAGDKPDFEAFRERLNAKIVRGSHTIGQEDAWERHEGAKEHERDRLSGRAYRDRFYHEPIRARPYGNPGPGVIAKVAKLSKDKTKCTFQWERKRLRETWRHRNKNLRASYTCSTKKLLNVDAYTPGDFKQFFADPRTRQEYMQWAPYLIAAEKFHAGQIKVGVPSGSEYDFRVTPNDDDTSDETPNDDDTPEDGSKLEDEQDDTDAEQDDDDDDV